MPDRDDTALHELAGVEVFRAGTWNGDAYSADDIDAMVAAFGEVGFRPPVKLGHAAAPGAPAYGWVKALRRAGERLIADLADLPGAVFEAIRARAFDAVSAEILWNFRREGRVFPRVLKAVALLGAEIPAVAGLKPLREVALAADDFEALRACVLPPEAGAAEEAESETETGAERTAALAAEAERAHSALARAEAAERALAGLREERRRERIARKLEGLSLPALRAPVARLYEAATRDPAAHAFAAEDPSLEALVDDLVALVNRLAGRVLGALPAEAAERADAAPFTDASAEVDRRARARVAAGEGLAYAEAVAAVLAADPELKRAYAGLNR